MESDYIAAVDISIVVPLFNEQDSIRELHRRIHETMHTVGREWELIFVNDGSSDETGRIMAELAAGDDRLVCVELMQNFGQTPALAAGFDLARGRVIVAMDGDLQHDPAEIPRFLEAIDKGYDLVSGWRKRRVDGPIRKIPSRIANWLIGQISGVRIHDFGTTFKAYRRELLSELRLYGDMHRYIPALAAKFGARIGEIEISNIPRPHGKSNYGIGRTFAVMLDLIGLRFYLKYLTRPLRFFGKIGLWAWAGAAALTGYLLVDKLAFGVPILTEHGPIAAIALLLAVLGGMSISTGLIADMTARTYHEATGRRIYHVRSVVRSAPRAADASQLLNL